MGTNRASPDEIRKRIERADRLGFKPRVEEGSLKIPFTNNFDTFADNVAHALRKRLTYRSDGGRLARGFVRYRGDREKSDLEIIHERNLRRTGARKLQTLSLQVYIIRLRTEQPTGRWVIGIRFKENLIDIEREEIPPLTPSIHEEAKNKRTKLFLAKAFSATLSMGCKGNRLRNLIRYAQKIGYPRNHKLWVYERRTVDEYVWSLTNEQRKKLPSAIPDGGSPRLGLDYHKYPFEGKLFAPRLRQKLPWRFYPIRDRLYLRRANRKTIEEKLEEMYDEIILSRTIVVVYLGTQADAASEHVGEFSKHLNDLFNGKKTKYRGEESVYHFFKRPCKE